MSYIGNEPIVSATRTVTEITATAGQTTFTATGGYTVGFIDVFVNGAQLQTSDFTATNGSTVVLNNACVVNDDVRLVAWGKFNVSSLIAPSYTGGLTGDTGIVNIGSGQVYKDTSGNVGIGTTSPSYLLDVNGVGRVAGLRQTFQTGLYNVDGALSNYSATNGVYLNGNAAGWLRLCNDGTQSTKIDLYGSSYGTPNIIKIFTAGTQQAELDAAGLFKFNSGYGSVATAYGCRAWVNFNSTTIRGSGGVSSISRASAGQYTVNFSITFPDTNYSVQASASSTQSNTYVVIGVYTPSNSSYSNKTTTACAINAYSPAVANYDPYECDIAFFR